METEAESGSRISSRVTLEHLPVEILTAIFENLCMHCRLPHIVDAAPSDIAEAHQEQQALARLSRTSRWLRMTAQPVLFHYYHSKSQHACDENQAWDRVSLTREIDTLQSFLQAILAHPYLARSVRALSFYAFRAVRALDVPPETQALFRQAGRIAGFQDLATYEHVESKWLQEAAIMAAPFLEQLLLHRSSQEGLQYLKDSPHKLPNLKYLILPGRGSRHDESYHIQEMQDLLFKAENLKVLAASDCDCGTDIPMRERWRMEAWTTSLSHLRRLSLHGLDPENVGKILQFCPALEDFEYFCDVDKYTVLQHEHVDPVRLQLRRFCYTGLSYENTKGGPQDVIELMTNFMVWSPALRADFTFGNYPRLEILEVEQMLLYGPVFHEQGRAERFEASKESGPELFMASLPSALRILHIGMVLAWPELYRDLLGMSKKLYRFPDLEIVAVDPFDIPLDEEMDNLEEAFTSHGVAFHIGITTQTPFSRGMMGVRPGHTEPVDSAGLRFPLEKDLRA